MSNRPFRVALNGYGRIGRCVLRALHERGDGASLEIVALNDLADQASKREPNTVTVQGLLVDPREYEHEVDAPILEGGVDFLVLNGWRTEFNKLDLRASQSTSTLSGVMTRTHDGDTIDAGQVVVTAKVEGSEALVSASAPVDSFGTFAVDIVGVVTAYKAIYVPGEDDAIPYGISQTDWTTP